MKTPRPFTRREVLKAAALSALALPLLGRSATAEAVPSLPANSTAGSNSRKLRLGMASLSLGKLPVAEVINVLRQLEITNVALHGSHAPWQDGTPEQCRAIVQRFKDAGITVTSTAIIRLSSGETAVRKALDNVRAAGLTTLCGSLKSTQDLPLLDKLAKEYDLKIALHNHGPTDTFPAGMDVWNAVQPYDKRLGLCLDVAHGFRAGENAADTIRKCRERLYQLHMRDTAASGGGSKDTAAVVVGHGLVDIRSIVAALLEIDYAFTADFEYEKEEDNPVPGIAESVGYVRGLLAGMPA